MFSKSCCLVVVLTLVSCTGTRLYQRADRAASQRDYHHAVAYDAAALRDGRELPDHFEAHFNAHTAAFVDDWLAKLGPPSDANADHQEDIVRALIAYVAAQKREAVPALGTRLGELAKVRWPRVTVLRDADRIDEAAAAAARMTTDAAGVDDLVADAATLAAKARDRHVAAIANAKPSTAAIHARLGHMFGASENVDAEAALDARTGIALTVKSSGGGLCEDAVQALTALLPPRGDTPATFTFRFTACEKEFEEASYTDERTSHSTEYRNQEVYDLKPSERCETVQRPTAPICDSSTDHGEYYTRNCHTETTDAQVCSTSYDRVPHTERVAYTTETHYEVTVHTGRLKVHYSLELEAELLGHKYVMKDFGWVTSSTVKSENGSVSEGLVTSEIGPQIAKQLAETTGAMTRWAMSDKAKDLERQAAEARARGDEAAAVEAWVEAGVIERAAPAPLVEVFAAVKVPKSMIDQAMTGGTWSELSPKPPDIAQLGIPVVPDPEVLEDAHEITTMQSLTAQKRAMYQGAFFFGRHRYHNTDPATPLSSTGSDLVIFGGGASPTSIPYLARGGSMHLEVGFDSKLTSIQSGAVFGAGLRVLGLSVMPVAGGEAHGATHANPDEANFIPGANARQGGIDFMFGGQLTLALPYPLNLTINARALKTLPIFIAAGIPGSDTVSRMGTFATSRFEVYLGWRIIPVFEVLVFARYNELASEKGGGVWTMFGGDGDLRASYTFGIGLGGGFDHPPWQKD